MTLRSCRDLLARRIEDYAWHRTEGPIPLAHYQAALGELERRARAIPGILGMYDLGPIRYPGLSDIDVVFVLEDEFADFSALRPLLREALPAQYGNVVLHDPYFLRRGDFEHFLSFAPIFEYRAIWCAPDLPQHGQASDPLDLTLFLMDIIAESYPREFILALAAPAIDERMLISRLKGLAYCFNLLERIGGGSEVHFKTCAESITKLRTDFFTLSEPERARQLLELTREALWLSQRLALNTMVFLKEKLGLWVEGRLDLYCANNSAIYSDAAEIEPFYDTVRLRRTEVFTVVPTVFGGLVREYAKGEGPFSARLRARMCDGLRLATLPEEFTAAVRRRAALRNRHTAWVDATGLGLSTFLAFGYRTRRRLGGLRGLKEIAGRLTDRAREELVRRRMEEVRFVSCQ